jgi:hypothetical protein
MDLGSLLLQRDFARSAFWWLIYSMTWRNMALKPPIARLCPSGIHTDLSLLCPVVHFAEFGNGQQCDLVAFVPLLILANLE